MHFCNNCNAHFNEESKLDEHLKLGCEEHPSAQIVLLIEGKNDMVYFKNIQHQIVKPFAIYADIEAYTNILGIMKVKLININVIKNQLWLMHLLIKDKLFPKRNIMKLIMVQISFFHLLIKPRNIRN